MTSTIAWSSQMSAKPTQLVARPDFRRRHGKPGPDWKLETPGFKRRLARITKSHVAIVQGERPGSGQEVDRSRSADPEAARALWSDSGRKCQASWCWAGVPGKRRQIEGG